MQIVCRNWWYEYLVEHPEVKKIARPRFELGSKAPKASMLGHYSRRNLLFLHRAPGYISVYILLSL
jgi:hypothetical protein